MAGTLLIAGNPRKKRRKRRSTRTRKYRRNPVPYALAANPRRRGMPDIFNRVLTDGIPAAVGAIVGKGLYDLTALRGGQLFLARMALAIAGPLAIGNVIGQRRATAFGTGALIMAVLPYVGQVWRTIAGGTAVAPAAGMGDVPYGELGDVPVSELSDGGGIEILDGQPEEIDFELFEGGNEPFRGADEPFLGGHSSRNAMAARFAGG